MDEALIQLYFQRSEDAVRQTDHQYGPFCRAIIRSILPQSEDVEECVNDVYLAVWNAIPPTRPQNFKSWLGVIARNAALAKLRKQRRHPHTVPLSELEGFLPGTNAPVSSTTAKELADAISAFLGKQPQPHRIAFIRRYWYQDSIVDLARHMGWTQAKTKSVLFRMRSKLRTTLIEEGLWYA